MNATAAFFLPVGIVAPVFAWAQASGEMPDAGPRLDPPPSVAATVSEQRSPLWIAVDAVRRQRDAASVGADRRLTAEQRLQLRDQIRRAAMRPALETAPAVPFAQH